MKKIACLILFFLVCIVNIFPGNGDIKFEHISIKEGLSQSIVECIARDSKGFMWFGTEDGLNRYDGYKFTVLKHELQNPNSLGHDNLMAVPFSRAAAERCFSAVSTALMHFTPMPSKTISTSPLSSLLLFKS
jgi:hypothetical protein